MALSILAWHHRSIPATPEEGYHLTEDMAARTVAWIRQQKALIPDKPFFVAGFILDSPHETNR